jgi:hypothetical protein
MKEKTKKPRFDYTRKVRAERRQAYLDAAARRMGLLDWGALAKWARECMEMAGTDADINAALGRMLTICRDGLQAGTNGPAADVAEILAKFPIKEK